MVKTDLSGLGKWSNTPIDLVCDHCGVEKTIKYKLYTSYGYVDGEYLCRNCKLIKNNQEKWGVDNVFQLESVKEKSKSTNLSKRGVEFITQSETIKEKVKKSISQLDMEKINKKRKETVIEKWGVDNVSKSETIKDNKREKYLLNWDSTNNKSSDHFRKEHFKISKDPNYIKYLGLGVSEFLCDKCNNNYEIDVDVYHKRTKYQTILCTICNPVGKHQSGKELQIYDFIKSNYNGTIIQNYKKNRFEIDIYLPDLKIGFEFNGIYWHSEKYKDKWSHRKKTELFKKENIQIINIWEDDWVYKKEIIKSQIKNKLNLSKKIYARKCIVKEITETKIIKDFLYENHIQGYVNSKIKLGLYYNDELLSVMSFDQFEGRKKMKGSEWNLNRFCNLINYTIVGGASKLLNYFIYKYKPERIISYSDIDWSDGNLYQILNFEKVYETKPDYKYILNDKRYHKSNFAKNEKDINNLKIWDCGKIKWELLLNL